MASNDAGDVAARIPSQRIGALLVGRSGRPATATPAAPSQSRPTSAKIGPCRVFQTSNRRVGLAAHGNVRRRHLDRHPLATPERALARQVDALEKEILDVGVGIGDAPRNARVVAQHDEGRAGNRDAGRHRALRRRDASRTRPTGTRSADADRWPGSRRPLFVLRPGDHPVVAVARACAPGCSHSSPRPAACQGSAGLRLLGLALAASARLGPLALAPRGSRQRRCSCGQSRLRNDRRRARRIPPRQLAAPSSSPNRSRQGGADQLGLVVLGQAPRQQPRHRQRVDRRPRAGLDAEQLELERALAARSTRVCTAFTPAA